MPNIVIYGTLWCNDCVRAKRFLDEHQQPYEYFDIENQPELSARVIQYNEQLGVGSKRRIPIIIIGDQVLSEPSNDELARAVGFQL